MTVATHNADLQVTVNLEASPPQSSPFGVVAIIVDQATNSLNGIRTVLYSSYAEAVAAEDAGYISSTTLAGLRVAFSQARIPSGVRLIRRSLSGTPETIEAVIAGAEALASDFYAICIPYSRADADILALSAACETRTKIAVIQSDDSALITGTYPSGLADLQDRDRTVGVYHTTDAQWGDVAWACLMLTFDPDFTSAPWAPVEIDEVAALTSLSDSQRGYLVANNWNVMLAFGPYSAVMKEGVTTSGLDVASIITADWFQLRLKEDIAALMVKRAARGEKVPVSPIGQALLLGVINGRLQTAVDAGHLDPGTAVVVPEVITSGDRTAKRLRFTLGADAALQLQIASITANIAA